MTEPDRIFMAKYTGLSPSITRGEETPSPDHAPRTEYIRRDPAVLAALPEVQALIAAAYGVAAQTAADRCAACGCREIASLVKEHVIRRAPADATAALARVEREAEARGRVKGLREAAEIACECGKEVDPQDGSYVCHHPLRGFVFKDAILSRAAEIEKAPVQPIHPVTQADMGKYYEGDDSD